MFEPTFNLWDLNGSNGFAINGIRILDESGLSVSSACGPRVPALLFASTKDSLNSRQNISDETLNCRYESNQVKVR